MKIQLNGESFEAEAGTTISQLVHLLELQGKRIAVECNREIVPRSEHEQVILQENDNVEIVHAIGGG